MNIYAVNMNMVTYIFNTVLIIGYPRQTYDRVTW